MSPFEEKIHFERRVIGVVNRYCSGDRQLTGLTREALADWQNRNNGLSSTYETELLVKLSSMSNSLNDISGHVGETADVLLLDSDVVLTVLEQRLASRA